MDVIITLLLVATIFYAIKLSKHLDTFRSNRADMEHLIRELSSQITRAQEGISVLDDLATSRGDELRRSIHKAQAIIDELQLVTDAGDSLASRLENLATRTRTGGDAGVSKETEFLAPQRREARYEDTLRHKENDEDVIARAPARKEPFFAIRDPDFGGEGEEGGLGEDDDSSEFLSQAERDLARALEIKQTKRKP